MDKFTVDYIEAMLWAETDETGDQEGEPFDKNHTSKDLAPETIEAIKKDCKAFQDQAEKLITEDPHPGHDFYLTRNGHGAGFWDGDYMPESRGKELTRIAQTFGECSPYKGDDGLIYLSN